MGGALGVVALKVGSADTFRAIVPALILLACGLLAAGPGLRRRMAARQGDGAPAPPTVVDAAVVLTGVYIYFGARGAGVMLLSVLALLVTDTLQRLNALNRLLVLIVNAPAAVVLAFLGPGGLDGGGGPRAHHARRRRPRCGARPAPQRPGLRAAVITIGVGVAVYLIATA